MKNAEIATKGADGSVWLSSRDVPAGYWQRNIDHFPYPVTPLTADLRLGKHGRVGQRRARDDFSMLNPPRVPAVIDGYVYNGPVADYTGPSPDRIAAFERNVEQRFDQIIWRRWQEEVRPFLLSLMERMRKYDLAGMTDGALLDHFRGLDDGLQQAYFGHYNNGHPRNFRLGACAAFCRDHFRLEGLELFELLAGASTASSDPTAALEAVARKAVAEPSAAQALQDPDPWASRTVQDLLRPYLDRYGFGLSEFEYASPTLAERPERVVQLLREAVTRLEAGEDGSLEKVRTQRDARLDELEADLNDEASRAEFRSLVEDAQAVYGARDDEMSICMGFSGLIRYAFLEMGRRLAGRGLLSAPERVFFLRLAELEACFEEESAPRLRELANDRYAQHLEYEVAEPPFSFGTRTAPQPRPTLSPRAEAFLRTMSAVGEGAAERQAGPVSDLRDGELRGLAASAGSYTGPARVVLSEEQFDRVQPGDVLVCPSTGPAWGVVFGKVRALVTDVGSLLSHPSIIAREFGIPAVVATKTATKTIKDGQIVHVDGTAGVIRWD